MSAESDTRETLAWYRENIMRSLPDALADRADEVRVTVNADDPSRLDVEIPVQSFTYISGTFIEYVPPIGCRR